MGLEHLDTKMNVRYTNSNPLHSPCATVVGFLESVTLDGKIT